VVGFRIVWCWVERDGRLNSRYPLLDMNLRTPRREVALLRVQLRRAVRGTLTVEAVCSAEMFLDCTMLPRRP
jgi:hypothetical protein